MQPKYPNKLKAIVGEFYIMESRINNRSKKAQKKIQSWKASHTAVDADENYQQQFENLLKQSFFNTVTNGYILANEGYFDRPLKN
jgi:hypothetical protein